MDMTVSGLMLHMIQVQGALFSLLYQFDMRNVNSRCILNSQQTVIWKAIVGMILIGQTSIQNKCDLGLKSFKLSTNMIWRRGSMIQMQSQDIRNNLHNESC